MTAVMLAIPRQPICLTILYLCLISTFSGSLALADRTDQQEPPTPDTQPEELIVSHVVPAATSATSSTVEYLTVEHEVVCEPAPEPYYRKINARADIYAKNGETEKLERRLRFDLVPQRPAIHQIMGERLPNLHLVVKLYVENNPHCRYEKLKPVFWSQSFAELNLEDTAVLARRFVPFLNVREDQLNNRNSDLALKVVYRVLESDDESVALEYVIFFSDQDSNATASKVFNHFIELSRSVDIEWFYRVTLTQDSATGAINVTKAEY